MHASRSRAAAPKHPFAVARRVAYEAVLSGAWSQAEQQLSALSDDSRFGVQDWIALATTRYRLGRLEDTVDAAGRALALEPDNLKASHLLTLALIAQNRWSEALPVFERQTRPEARQHYQFVVNHGTTLSQLGRTQDAVNVFLEAMVLNMADPAIHMKLALALKDLKLYQESAESFTTAWTLDPKRYAAQLMATHMRQHACQWEGLDEACAQILEATARLATDGLRHVEGAVFTLAGIDHPPALFRTATALVATSAAHGAVPLPARPIAARGERRLRVGYVSSDFHNHATALLFVEALEQRNRDDFEVTLYSHSPDDGTLIEQRIRAACERFVDMRAMSIRQMADRIHADGIDILVDLKGHTQGNRIGVFAYRPAPIQATFLGFPGTSGADYIDYFIGDRWVTPLDDAPSYSEKIAQLPHCYQPNDSKRQRPLAVPRSACGLPDDALVLGCFNQAFKLTPQTFDVWMRILLAVPRAILWMLEDNPQASANLRHEARKRGVAPERLVFAPKIAFTRHLARLPAVDLMLDNWPCNAHTTASDALWMGVPLLTMRGRTFASRVAGSLLRAVNLPELVCDTPEAYESKAIALLNDPTRLAALRKHLEDGRAGFPLFDGRRFAGDLEALYRRMADRAREGLPPDHLPAVDPAAVPDSPR